MELHDCLSVIKTVFNKKATRLTVRRFNSIRPFNFLTSNPSTRYCLRISMRFVDLANDRKIFCSITDKKNNYYIDNYLL